MIEPEDEIITQEMVGSREIIAIMGETILVDGDYDGEYFATQFHWRVSKAGYVYANGLSSSEQKRLSGSQWKGYNHGSYVYLHHLVAGPMPPSYAGRKWWRRHKNGNKLDNRSTNIEWVTAKQSANERPQTPPHIPKNPRSLTYTPYRGVARQMVNGVPGRGFLVWVGAVYEGTFYDLEEAARHYDEVAFYKWGKRAILNFPDEWLDEADK